MNRTVNLQLLNAWAKGKFGPTIKIAALADVSPETVRRVFKGECPKTGKVRIKISSAIGVDEDELFPIIGEVAA